MNPETENLLLFTQDSYKAGHHRMYMPGTEHMYSYLESRNGAQYPYTVWFGLQYIIKRWLTKPVTQEMVDEFAEFCKLHFVDDKNVFNKKGWNFIVKELGGYLPLRIKSVPEGMKVPISNVMMTCENTHPECPWLTNVLETVLSTVWYTSVVATKSHVVMQIIKKYFGETSDSGDFYKFYLHDFGQRGTTCMEQAGLGGMAHLLNARGTDTMMAFPYAKTYYDANLATVGYSVKASEHSIMTSMGEENEFEVTKHIIKSCPDGILSVVSDSYNIENAIKVYCTTLKSDILNRNGKFVIRPDSPRFKGDTCANQVYWIADQLWTSFGGTVNSKGYRILNPKVGIIYGDGIDMNDIEDTLELLKKYKFSAENCVYGMGGGLLQRGLNRDTQRNAFKASSTIRNGISYDIFKNPSDITKASKKGRMKYVFKNGIYQTVSENDEGEDIMQLVYENGKLYNEMTFDQIRENVDRH
jgi:nicotinamide phosphoribosyltransferase